MTKMMSMRIVCKAGEYIKKINIIKNQGVSKTEIALIFCVDERGLFGGYFDFLYQVISLVILAFRGKKQNNTMT